jgi:hypothetical protein
MHRVSGWSGLMSIKIACNDAFFQHLPYRRGEDLVAFYHID